MRRKITWKSKRASGGGEGKKRERERERERETERTERVNGVRISGKINELKSRRSDGTDGMGWMDGAGRKQENINEASNGGGGG